MRAYLASMMIAFALAFAPVTPGAAAVQKDNKEDKAAKKAREAELARNATPVLWRDPGAVERLDFVNGPGGAARAPKPPFTFVEEDLGGSNPKIKVTDANGTKWGVKWGSEVHSEVFASRVAWAAGYFVEPTYFVSSGKIVNVDRGQLTRAKRFIQNDGSFENARFELKLDTLAKLNDEEGWGWNSNPFTGTKELDGLKVVVMLVSNWDNKDVRDVSRGSNTAIFVVPGKNGKNEAHYIFTDWGGSMGKWGGVLGREKWDAKGYAKQTADFYKGGQFGYKGQHTSDFANNIPPAHVAWVAQYLGRITDQQLRDGLQAAGATPDEVSTFAPAIRDRINQLKTAR
jgi:hypothetical protein